ncbi:MAG: PDZ domain-containing protein, partial [Paludibacteraceae bacterium]|nr:PDZ domain-containing protein [Paludibacteraceae bacterium]
MFQAFPAKQGSEIPDELMNSLLKYAKVCQIIEQNYVDSVSYDTLCTNAIAGMLKKLDPHSSYLTPKQVRASNEVLRSGFDGIGISYNMIDDTLNIIQVIPDGPSEHAGLRVGDKILYADTVCIAGRGLSNDDIQKCIRGKRGTALELRLLRDGDVIRKKVKRGHIPIHSVTASYLVSPGIGYIM